ncbi:MAG: M50 family metallopeptidase [Methanoregula sp.]|nr:M50 family metallopeptidase [Methanoregula sp.]
MEALSFLIVIATGIVVMLISTMLDHLWAQVLPMRIFYYLVRAPGVVVHECSHMLGCLLTGATITNVVLFSKEGGSVTYTRPKLPILGDVIISSAPLFCIPLFLTGLTWCFSAYLGCTFPQFPVSIDSAGTLHTLGAGIVELFSQNLVTAFHPWFLLYLYLTLSLVLSVAPSRQDIRNAAVGLVLIALLGLLIFLSAVPWAVSILWEITSVIGMGFALGLAFGLIALVISLPLFAWYIWTSRPHVP